VSDAPAAPRAKVESTWVGTTGSPVQSGFPCAMVLTAYFVLSPVTGLFCHRRLADWWRARPGWAATCLRKTWRQRRGVRTTRLRRPQQHRSSARRITAHKSEGQALRFPLARWRCRVHRIPPHVRDDREPPLLRARRADS